MNKSLLVASFAVLTASVFGMQPTSSQLKEKSAGANQSTIEMTWDEYKKRRNDKIIVSDEEMEMNSIEDLEIFLDPNVSLENLKKLKIKIKCENLTQLPSEIGNLTDLKELNISSCYNLTLLPSEIGNLKNLEKLTIISCDNLTRLPSEIGNLKNLKELDIICENLTQLPSKIGNLKNLKELNITCRNLTLLPSEIGNLKKLEELYIRNCEKLPQLPSEIGNLKNLETLEILLCFNLTQLPSGIGNLKNLKRLDTKGTTLTQLPSEIGNLKSLKVLDLMCCTELTRLPSEIGNLKNLEELYLEWRNLTRLPAEIGNLINLRRFCVRSSMPELSTYHVTKDSTIADLSNRSLEQVPFDIVGYQKLEELNLSNNHLEELPALMIQLQNLKKIDLRGNEKIDSINKVPVEIFGIPKLETIVLTEKGKSREYNREEFSNIRRRIYEEFRELEALFNLPADSQTVLKYLAISKNKIGVSTEKIKKYEKQSKELQKRQDQKISRFRHLKAIFDKLNVD